MVPHHIVTIYVWRSVQATTETQGGRRWYDFFTQILHGCILEFHMNFIGRSGIISIYGLLGQRMEASEATVFVSRIVRRRCRLAAVHMRGHVRTYTYYMSCGWQRAALTPVPV
jgi:hypothetical protein